MPLRFCTFITDRSDPHNPGMRPIVPETRARLKQSNTIALLAQGHQQIGRCGEETHEEAVLLHANYASEGKFDRLKTFAAATMKTVQHHAAMVKQLSAGRRHQHLSASAGCRRRRDAPTD
jgi:hypothetical protein